jgi:hypothetical protein
MLTPHQLTILRHDLRTLAHIEYEEVENELLDHYATLSEQKMAAGHDFEHASSYAWAELGAGAGLNKIQRDFEKNIRKQVSTRHLELLKNYFRWPTVVTTLLIGALMFVITPILSGKIVIVFLWASVIIPIAVLQYAYLKCKDQRTDSKKIVWESLGRRSGFVLNIVNVTFHLSVADDQSKRAEHFQVHTSISAIICFLAILYTLSFIQLYRENFHYKVA